jgi:hypothetical protein
MSSMYISKPKIQHDQHGYYIGREKTLNGIPMPYSRESKYFSSKETAQQAIEFGFYFRDTEENIALFEKYKSDYILYDGFFVKLV